MSKSSGMRKSSKGNPWHDAKGRFCHGPEARTDTWGNPITEEQREEAVLKSEKSDLEYKARTIARISNYEAEQRKKSFEAIVNDDYTEEDIAVLEKESEYQEELLRKHSGDHTEIPTVELERRNEFRIAAVAYMKSRGEETIDKYAKDNQWDTSRMREQTPIIREYLEKAEQVPHNGECLISGGLGGAGKSTVLRKCLGINDKADYITINADDIKEEMAKRNMIPTFRGLTPMECSELVHEEASDLSKRVMKKAVASKTNVILDITMSSYGSVKGRCELLKKNGYTSIQPVFVDISPEISRTRALNRYRRGMNKYTVNEDGCGGRPLPAHVINSNLTEGKYKSKNAETLVALANDGWFTDTPIVYDNEGDGPVKIEWTDFIR